MTLSLIEAVQYTHASEFVVLLHYLLTLLPLDRRDWD